MAKFKAQYLIASALLSLMNPVGLAAQDYIPMNFEKGRWFVDIDEYGGYFERTQMYCNGDTVINSQVFSKLFQDRFIMEPSIGVYFSDTIIAEYVGAIRNAEDKQVVFRSASADTEVIIYDFNLSIGDTINGEYEDFIINHIDSVEYCGIYHKRYIQLLDGGLIDETLTEGIGFANGLLGYFYQFNNRGENTRVLICYTERGNNECPVCENLLSIDSHDFETLVYPIPAENYIAIKSSKPISCVRIISISGTEAFCAEYSNQLFVQESIEAFLPGVYLMEIMFVDNTQKTSVIIKN
ncbi:MAG: hypothetical protein V2B15_18970 [Bacteroidota bacterium]